MKSSIILELQYLGPVQYYSKFIKYETVYFEQHENYRKGSFRNRCYIATANGIVTLSIPLLKGKHQQAPIKTVSIDNRKNWQIIHWRSIQTAYGNSPYFDYYKHELQILYEKKYDLLFEFCLDVQEVIFNALQITPTVHFTSSYSKETQEDQIDMRNIILPKTRSLANDIHFDAYPYPQVFEDRLGFLPNLSILDLLFCTGPEAYQYLQMSSK
ncbi:MAG: WbqC family protein [Saprospiraceae bacterium]|nr:WbqC family protein [Saprospiraceae bacterium]